MNVSLGSDRASVLPSAPTDCCFWNDFDRSNGTELTSDSPKRPMGMRSGGSSSTGRPCPQLRAELVESFIARAEASAAQAIVVTLDTHMLGWRPRDLSLGYLPFAHGQGIAQYRTDYRRKTSNRASRASRDGRSVARVGSRIMRPCMSCKPCRSMGPSTSSSRSRSICTR